MSVRAKFKVNRIERSLMNTQTGYDEKKGQAIWGYVEVQTIVMSPVVSGSDENKAFYAATPSGEIKLATINAEAASQFELMKDYYVDFSPAE